VIPTDLGGHATADPSVPESVFPALIGAADVWERGVTGQDVGIAVIDSGVYRNTQDLNGRIAGEYWAVQRGPSDNYGHGTHVAGVAAGDGSKSLGRYMGIAPKAKIISIKVGNFNEGPRLSDVIQGFEFVLAHRAKHNIRIANLSFTSSLPESYLTSPLAAAVEQLWFRGIVVVAAQGNRGSALYSVDHPPANDPFVISVGAISDNGTLDAGDDFLKEWSSRGVTREGFAKPELVAPGSRLIATMGTKRAILYEQYPENRVGEHYFRMGGTSVAAPVVSGVVALMLEHNPSLTPDEVKARLMASAAPVAGSAAPRVDAYAAVFGPSAGSANEGLFPSLWIDRSTGSVMEEPLSADAITWDAITWDAITWDAITWDAITWDAITWDALTWDAITWDSIIWD
jgi:serine protease AprX